MNKPVIISGEAPETESEDESIPDSHYTTCSNQNVIKADVVTGEDSESENENDGGSICSAVSALNDANLSESDPKPKSACDKTNSLLHQKLREANGKLYQDIENYCQNVIGEAGKSLASIDQHLIKSQLTLQSAVTSLKAISNSSAAIKNKLQSLLSAQFIPNINVSSSK